MTGWCNQNENRSYPFIKNRDATRLSNSEILDCRFYITNPENELDLKVFLKSKKEIENGIVYTFCHKIGTDEHTLSFIVPESDDWQCIWNTDDPRFYGFIIAGN